MYSYAITINKVSDPVFISDYERFVDRLFYGYPKCTFKYHYEETRDHCIPRLHMHGIITNPRKVKISSLAPETTGWHVHWTENPTEGWTEYIEKYMAGETNLINRQHELEREYKEFNTECEEQRILDEYASRDYPTYPTLDIRKLKS